MNKIKVTAWVSKTSGNGFLSERYIEVGALLNQYGCCTRENKQIEIDTDTGEPDGRLSGLWHFAIIGSVGRLGVFRETLQDAKKALETRSN